MDIELVRAAPAVEAACLPPSNPALYPRGDKERASGLGRLCIEQARQQVECASPRLTLRPVPAIFSARADLGEAGRRVHRVAPLIDLSRWSHRVVLFSRHARMLSRFGKQQRRNARLRRFVSTSQSPRTNPVSGWRLPPARRQSLARQSGWLHFPVSRCRRREYASLPLRRRPAAWPLPRE